MIALNISRGYTYVTMEARAVRGREGRVVGTTWSAYGEYRHRTYSRNQLHLVGVAVDGLVDGTAAAHMVSIGGSS